MSSDKSIGLLAEGLLNQFSSLKDLDDMVTNLTIQQDELLKNSLELNLNQSNEKIEEISLMIKKMNFYRLKLRHLRSEMLYIYTRVTELKKRALEIQTIKVEQKAERIKRNDYEKSLIGKSKK